MARLEVRVKRRGVNVKARPGYWQVREMVRLADRPPSEYILGLLCISQGKVARYGWVTRDRAPSQQHFSKRGACRHQRRQSRAFQKAETELSRVASGGANLMTFEADGAIISRWNPLSTKRRGGRVVSISWEQCRRWLVRSVESQGHDEGGASWTRRPGVSKLLQSLDPAPASAWRRRIITSQPRRIESIRRRRIILPSRRRSMSSAKLMQKCGRSNSSELRQAWVGEYRFMATRIGE